MKKIGRSIVAAFSMYSRIPMPHVEWTEESMRYAMCFFPWIGLVIGVLEALWQFFTGWFSFGTIFRTAGILLIPILVTGGIHFDGFMDTMDAMSSWRQREDRLRILKDSHIGAFAVIGAAGYFLAAFGAASEIREDMVLSLCLVFFVARTFSALSVETFPSANPKGTAAAFADGSAKKTVRGFLYFYLAAAFAVMLVTEPWAGICVTGSALFTFWLYHHICIKYFGGMTGDLAGFFVSICELTSLLTTVIVGGIIA